MSTTTAPRCPLCGGRELDTFVRRARQPVHQNLLADSAEAARGVARGQLDMSVCCACGFVFNSAFDAGLLSYGAQYDNTQSCSAHFEAYLDGLVRDLVERCGVRNSRIVEVGCGKGEFLRKLVSYPGARNTGQGFDPSYLGPASDLDGRLQFHTRFYDADCADVPADVVICRHVIEHVAEPLPLLRSVHAALAQAGQPRVFFETPCVDWILRNQVVWDFFYEHCSLFSASTLGQAFERSGFKVERVDHVFEGQYLWLQASREPAPPSPGDGRTLELARAYGRAEAQLRQRWQQRLAERPGRIALWGAGAKGVTLANLVDPERRLIACVVDVNPNKQGRFLPGTGHPIVAPAELARHGVDAAVLMNPNYRQENLALLAALGSKVELLDWQ
ncbi:class I SAM-dependent methyltransferase [Roseateles violae]|uniref:Class I SAM-dependent methyltransferase n=1 Tax=Roseateles violae TaxID=3058042 RepID=A0ABT8DWT8_9BURK|nr:class I SAM-dependent methyltransferase [Pelomonas sp. PFR6]MDN3921585.1 class I SAM-dependent methyltransferase [Pelomonas sp. PFR6]